MLQDFLTLKTVQVSRNVQTPDGMGGLTTTTVLTTLPRAAMWSPTQSQRFISDKMARASTDVLVTLPKDYSFTDQDSEVIFNGKTFRITGHSDNVFNMGEISITGLEYIS